MDDSVGDLVFGAQEKLPSMDLSTHDVIAFGSNDHLRLVNDEHVITIDPATLELLSTEEPTQPAAGHT